MADVLKESSEARKYSISLQHLEYGGDLVERLRTHSTKLEKIYGRLQDLQKRRVEEPDRYLKFYNIVDDMHKWYETAEDPVSDWLDCSGSFPLGVVSRHLCACLSATSALCVWP